jgi:hypothetical protein
MKKENNKQTDCEQTSSLTQVSTTYARICVILLALNFCVTGYVMAGVLKLQQEAVSTPTPPTTMRTQTGAKATVPTSLPSPIPEVETLEKK